MSMHTGLSPEWEPRYDAAFADLVVRDDDLVRAEFTRLIEAAGLPIASLPTPRAWGGEPSPDAT